MAEERRRYVIEFRDVPTERQGIPELAVEERRGNFKEVELGFTEEMAMREARRCLSCRRCLGCGLCLAECHTKAIDFEQADQDVELVVDSIILTPGAERSPSPIPKEFGYGKYPNVVTGTEFERILSDNGPYGGLVIRPYDGEIPRRIAFLECLDHQDGHSLSYAVKEALIAQKKVEDLEAHLFFSNSGVDGLGKESKLSLRRAKVAGIKEIEGNKNVVIEFSEDGQTREEEFEMAVLSAGFDLPSDIEELNRKLGLEIKGRSFWETDDTSLIETSKAGVLLAGYALID